MAVDKELFLSVSYTGVISFLLLLKVPAAFFTTVTRLNLFPGWQGSVEDRSTPHMNFEHF